MRITEQAKHENRSRILKAAARLFAEKGFENTTTRDIAQEAGLAAGTMFNYFKSKESMAMSMVNEALIKGIDDYLSRRTGGEDLAEELFLFVSSGLKRLRPMQAYIGPVLEKSLSPFQKKNICEEGRTAQSEQLSAVRNIIISHGHLVVPEFISVHVYWSLYLGILAFWSKDDSAHQDATKAVIDYSIALFVSMITTSDPGSAEE